jgi:hypothetical protein
MSARRTRPARSAPASPAARSASPVARTSYRMQDLCELPLIHSFLARSHTAQVRNFFAAME